MKGLAQVVPITVINETSNFIYVPKNYGIQKFGIPPEKRILY
jgi:hypothetical protein